MVVPPSTLHAPPKAAPLKAANTVETAKGARAGFTLIELLIVISIIAALAGLITASISIAKSRAKRATCKAGINSIALANAAYHTVTGIYPGANRGPKDDPEALFRALYTANPKHGGSRENHLEDWDLVNLGLWTGAYQSDVNAIYKVPTDRQMNFDSSFTSMVFLDPWGRPFHYVEWKSHPRSRRQLSGGSLRAQGDKPFMIWSDGPDMINDWGKKDDITSWAGTKR